MEAKNQQKNTGSAPGPPAQGRLKRISAFKLEIFLSLVLAFIILLALLTHKPSRYKPFQVE